ncbi:thiamine pyrophosphate-binding protein [Arthrobacter gengyunqii]|uniref:Thiamine pyrophosphate-binding protein n=1 Tax=Arthrobacter gengyunqii TaxID=2886940 RepID=A0A9X1S4S5_9MICC|nr:thiamine pyrophosphate-binding protein [Arthrobacter gengyunqii]MCC3268615.1 thiamine pyrophosphate-binding protein [Arthrobacter gengyunqii]UOY96003.1 thiamine pyrophosphate-binding protein [Arthrobacter gengyunqii]
MFVAEVVGRTLAELGAGHCFGVVGSGNFIVTNALRQHGVPFTAARHEGGAATMADAYARVSGRVGLVSVHQGCGLTNAATGIGEAAKSRTPLIVLAAEAASSAVGSNFSMDQDGFARSVQAVPERIHSARTAVADTVRAYRRAVNDRRTVVLNLPLDLQAQEVPETAAAPVSVPFSVPVRPGRASVAALADLLEQAERPVFIAGRGGRGARNEVLALAEHAGALVATSAVAKGLFNGEKFNLGISGGFSSPMAADLITGADLIVGFGCALNMWTMRQGTLIGPETAVVQVDLEDAALGANRAVTLGVLGDSAETAAAVLTELVARGDAPRAGYRTDSVRQRMASIRWQDEELDDFSTDSRIDPRILTRRLDELLPRERIVAVDSGNFMGYPSQFLEVPDENGFCFTQAFQSIGLGLATAIGAAVARPDRLPVLGTGDGGFHMAVAELETAVRLELPLVCIVYNDAAYGAEVHHFGAENPQADMGTVVFPETDAAAIGRGFGADGLTVRTVQDLDAVSAWLASGPRRPLVIDAKIASDGGAWWLTEAFKGH